MTWSEAKMATARAHRRQSASIKDIADLIEESFEDVTRFLYGGWVPDVAPVLVFTLAGRMPLPDAKACFPDRDVEAESEALAEEFGDWLATKYGRTLILGSGATMQSSPVSGPSGAEEEVAATSPDETVDSGEAAPTALPAPSLQEYVEDALSGGALDGAGLPEVPGILSTPGMIAETPAGDGDVAEPVSGDGKPSVQTDPAEGESPAEEPQALSVSVPSRRESKSAHKSVWTKPGAMELLREYAAEGHTADAIATLIGERLGTVVPPHGVKTVAATNNIQLKKSGVLTEGEVQRRKDASRDLVERRAALLRESRERIGLEEPPAKLVTRPASVPQKQRGRPPAEPAANPFAPVGGDQPARRIVRPKGTQFRLRADDGRYLHMSGEGFTTDKVYAWKGNTKQLLATRQRFRDARDLAEEAADDKTAPPQRQSPWGSPL